MKKDMKKKLPALVLLLSTPLYAAMPAPTAPISANDKVIKCAGAGATGVMIEMLGGNLVGAAAVHLSPERMPLFLPVFGTANNAAPDPWLYNAYYNLSANIPTMKASSEAYVATSGPGSLDTETIIRGTIPLLVNRPHFILSAAETVAPFVEEIAKTESYAPSYGVGAGMANPEQIMATITSYAEGMQAVIDGSKGKLKGRYGNPVDIAADFADFYTTTMTYCGETVANLNKEVVKAITITGQSNDEWSVQDGSSSDIFNEYIKAAGGLPIGQTDTVMTTTELLEADVLLVSSAALKTALLSAFDKAGLKASELPSIYMIPTGVYGWNLRSPEGALTTPWLTSIFYPELAGLPEINPVYTTAYFYSNFYHYTGNLEEILGIVLTENSLPSGVSVDLSSWDASVTPAHYLKEEVPTN